MLTVVIFYLLVVWLATIYFFLELPYAYLLLPEILVHLLYVFGVYLLAGINYHFFKARNLRPLTHTGTSGDPTCHKCGAYKSAMTHHCRQCNSCVAGFDHHCPWLANCVGAHNHRHFIVFLVYLLVSVGTNVAVGLVVFIEFAHAFALSAQIKNIDFLVVLPWKLASIFTSIDDSKLKNAFDLCRGSPFSTPDIYFKKLFCGSELFMLLTTANILFGYAMSFLFAIILAVFIGYQLNCIASNLPYLKQLRSSRRVDDVSWTARLRNVRTFFGSGQFPASRLLLLKELPPLELGDRRGSLLRNC